MKTAKQKDQLRIGIVRSVLAQDFGASDPDSVVPTGPDCVVPAPGLDSVAWVPIGSCHEFVEFEVGTLAGVVLDTAAMNRFELEYALRHCGRLFGPYVPQQVTLFVRSDLDFEQMQQAYEAGVEVFITPELFSRRGAEFVTALQRTVVPAKGPDCVTSELHARVLRLLRHCHRGDLKAVEAWLAETHGESFPHQGPTASFPHQGPTTGREHMQMNFAWGLSCELLGRHGEAAGHFRRCGDLNPHFVPARMHLASALCMQEKRDEALAIYQELEARFTGNTERKVAMAAAYVDRNELFKAAAIARELEGAAQYDPCALEVQAYVAIASGDLDAISKVLGRLKDGGQLLAGHLNDLAIELAKAGNIGAALALYEQTHRIVRADLRYKVSLNIALTFLKTNQLDRSMNILERCEKEFGGSFEKLEKMRAAIIAKKAA